MKIRGVQLSFDDGKCIATPGGDPPTREHWYRQLCLLMRELARLRTGTWRKLAMIPGWSTKLRTLEAEFTRAYRDNDRQRLSVAYEKLEEHWRSGIEAATK